MPPIAFAHLYTTSVLIIASFFVASSSDISLHDTYYVISNSVLLIMLAVLFVLFALITWVIDRTQRRLSPILSWTHYLLTLICLIIIAINLYHPSSQPNTFEDYTIRDSYELYESALSTNERMALTVLVLLLSQALFLVNVIRASVIKKKGNV